MYIVCYSSFFFEYLDSIDDFRSFSFMYRRFWKNILVNFSGTCDRSHTKKENEHRGTDHIIFY